MAQASRNAAAAKAAANTSKMGRMATGYKLANDGHDTRSIQQYLGHRNITHTVRYTEFSSKAVQRVLEGLIAGHVAGPLFLMCAGVAFSIA